jgi:hypothetical protein
VALTHEDADAFLIASSFAAADPAHQPLTLSLRDAHPGLSVAGQHRLDAYIERTLGADLAILLEAAKASLDASGYGGG